MIKVGIIGATGYAGAELVRLLLGHSKVELVWLGSKSYIGKEFAQIYQNYFKLVDHICKDDTIKELAKEVDVIFTATPQGFCASLLDEEILSHIKVIDLSADFRLKNPQIYESWYGIEHKAKSYLGEAVYGLCEINREEVKKARLVANPGCYTTCSILSLYPLVKEGIIDNKSIIIDAKSGTSGAGRAALIDSLFCEVNENIKAYKVASHRHTPEIEEQLSYGANEEITVSFTPHLVPMNRGILVTAYANLKEKISKEKVREIYESYYGKENFIRILKEGNLPETRWVKG
ncbi:MAG TPA: N-acetyl-gamma-glutamyl-phosphate reductase, partial [Lachnospiraceae bacterium]